MVFQKFISQSFCCVMGASILVSLGTTETQAVTFSPAPPRTCYQESGLCFDDFTSEHQILANTLSTEQYSFLVKASTSTSVVDFREKAYFVIFPCINTPGFDNLEGVRGELENLLYQKANLTKPVSANWPILEPSSPSIEEESIPIRNVQHPGIYDVDDTHLQVDAQGTVWR